MLLQSCKAIYFRTGTDTRVKREYGDTLPKPYRYIVNIADHTNDRAVCQIT